MYKIIGLMSGTSLDGLDIAYCVFELINNKWKYHISFAETIEYSHEWRNRLSELTGASALEYVSADVDFGHWCGVQTNHFILRNHLQPDFIASHGHTIFHQPGRRITSQIGRGACITAETGIPVISDFRSLDVALGGQGAPLVPIGDELLFGEYRYCLNMGGFANISYKTEGKRVAHDICPANIVLNMLASEIGRLYDAEGRIAASGNICTSLLVELNALEWYGKSGPKSLGKEWVTTQIVPLLEKADVPVADKLATFCEHIVQRIVVATPGGKEDTVLVTGGGAFNGYLMGRLQELSSCTIVIPDALTINFKEALIFAFLGVLRYRNEVNSLASVTGASRDSCGGAFAGI
jgi:anhydro-N-acetylmuramic acid kinase